MSHSYMSPKRVRAYQPGEWVPEGERDTRWYLFTPTFMCRVRYIQTFSPEYLKHFGMPTSGVEEYDRQMANEMVFRMLTISQMVDYFAQGTTVEIHNAKDTALIYEYASNHLNAWKGYVETGFHVRDAPMKELQLLDRFAHSVYEHAQWHFEKPWMDSMFARKQRSLVTASREMFLPQDTPAPAATQEEQKPSSGHAPRQSLAEVFATTGQLSKTQLQNATKRRWER